MSETYQPYAAERVTFGKNLTMALQQKGSLLRPTVNKVEVDGTETYFDELGKRTPRTRDNDYSDVEPEQSKYQRRGVIWKTVYTSELMTGQQIERMLMDPTSSITNNMVMALGRGIDEKIIEAAFGPARLGENGAGTETWPVTGQVLPAAASGLTLEKLRKAKRKLDEAHNDPTEERYIICAAGQVDDMLSTVEVTSADYANVRALVAGQIDTFLGFKFITCQLLPIDPTSNVRRAVAWVKSAINLGVVKDISTRIDWVAMKQANLLYADVRLAASRMNPKKIVEIECVETAA